MLQRDKIRWSKYSPRWV